MFSTLQPRSTGWPAWCKVEAPACWCLAGLSVHKHAASAKLSTAQHRAQTACLSPRSTDLPYNVAKYANAWNY